MNNENNVFNIPSPDQWECYVEYFVIGHAEMVILARTSDAKTSIRIAFFGVEYFSGLIRWQSADFRYGSSYECVEILKTVPRSTKPIAPEWLGLFRLYQVVTDAGIVKIVAQATEILETTTRP